MGSIHTSIVFIYIALMISFSPIASSGGLTCESLDQSKCAFAVSSAGMLCVLERQSDGEGYTCLSSTIEAEGIKGWVETDQCMETCGLHRSLLGISSDSLFESHFTQKLCSHQCYQACPNIVGLYFNLAAGEGVFLPKLCEGQRVSARRSMMEIRSSGNVVLASEPAVASLEKPVAWVPTQFEGSVAFSPVEMSVASSPAEMPEPWAPSPFEGPVAFSSVEAPVTFSFVAPPTWAPIEGPMAFNSIEPPVAFSPVYVSDAGAPTQFEGPVAFTPIEAPTAWTTPSSEGPVTFSPIETPVTFSTVAPPTQIEWPVSFNTVESPVVFSPVDAPDAGAPTQFEGPITTTSPPEASVAFSPVDTPAAWVPAQIEGPVNFSPVKAPVVAPATWAPTQFQGPVAFSPVGIPVDFSPADAPAQFEGPMVFNPVETPVAE